MNPFAMMKIKDSFTRFCNSHPGVVQFVQTVGPRIQAGYVLELKVTDPDGKESVTNMRVTQEDLDLLKQLKEMGMK